MINKPDVFADVRDKRWDELNAEQQDRATELWVRDHCESIPETTRQNVQSLIRIIDGLRATLREKTIAPDDSDITQVAPFSSTQNLESIDVGPIEKWGDLIQRGVIPKGEHLIALREVPRYVAQNLDNLKTTESLGLVRVGEVDAMSYDEGTLYLRETVDLTGQFDLMLGATLYALPESQAKAAIDGTSDNIAPPTTATTQLPAVDMDPMKARGYINEVGEPVITTMTSKLLAYCRSRGMELIYVVHPTEWRDKNPQYSFDA